MSLESLPMVSSAADAGFYIVSIEARHRESRSMYQEHPEGTSDCSPGTSMMVGCVSYISRDDHPS